MKTRIFGPVPKVLALCNLHGADVETRHYGDGQVTVSALEIFQGGYDDYAGSFATAVVHAAVPGTLGRFSPRPGVWCSGIRV